jgi:hypothetical protein
MISKTRLSKVSLQRNHRWSVFVSGFFFSARCSWGMLHVHTLLLLRFHEIYVTDSVHLITYQWHLLMDICVIWFWLLQSCYEYLRPSLCHMSLCHVVQLINLGRCSLPQAPVTRCVGLGVGEGSRNNLPQAWAVIIPHSAGKRNWSKSRHVTQEIT